MRTKLILSTLLVASLAGNASFLISTFMKSSTPRSGLISQLALTPEQKKMFAASRQVFQAQRAETVAKMAALRSVLAEEFEKDMPARQEMLSAALGMVEVQTAMRPKMIDHLLSLHAALAPAQRTEFAKMMREGDGTVAGCPGAMLYQNRDDER